MREGSHFQEYQADPMTLASARAAYPLVYLHDASVTLGTWLQFVRRRLRVAPRRSGLMAIRDRRGIVHALFCYRVERDLRAHRRLCVSDLIVAHLPGSQIDRAVAASTHQIAAALGCQAISIALPFQPRLAAVPTREAMTVSWDGPSTRVTPSHH
jgi:hypothetical protein